MKYSVATLAKAKNLRIIDDALFRLIAARKEVCQEILRTLLDDDLLVVDDVTVQMSEISLHREIVLDALCVLGDGTLCNVEMQKTDGNDDIKRVRFHASVITANHTPKGTSFENIPNVKVLYITEYDALGNGQAITHISRCQKKGKQYLPVNDGEDIIFANTASKQRNKHTHLLKLFLRSDSFYDEMYPELSKAMKHFKDTEGGKNEMCKSIEEYAEERALDLAINICMDFGKKIDETIDYVCGRFPSFTRDYVTERFYALSDSGSAVTTK